MHPTYIRLIYGEEESGTILTILLPEHLKFK